MKKLILITGFIIPTTLFISCNNSKKIYLNNSDFKNPKPTVVVADSTQEPGYDRAQRAFYWYLMSLPEKKRQEWVNGTYSEKEVEKFTDTIDYKHNIIK